MIVRGRAHLLVVAAVAAALLSACDDAPPASTKAADKADRPSATSGPALPPQMVSAVSASKSSLIIGVHFALGAQPLVGKPLPVDVAIVPHREFSSLRVRFNSQEGLRLVSGEDIPPRPDVKPESILTHNLVLEPTREGVYMVTAAVESEADEGTITRIYSIPVIVQGGPAAAAAPASPPPPAPQS